MLSAADIPFYTRPFLPYFSHEIDPPYCNRGKSYNMEEKSFIITEAECRTEHDVADTVSTKNSCCKSVLLAALVGYAGR